MSFASPAFLWYFLPITLLLIWTMPRAGRNAIVAIVSVIFYAVGAGAFTVVFLISVEVNYLAGVAMDRFRIDSPNRATRTKALRWRRRTMVAAVTFDLAILIVWKYADFLTGQLSRLDHGLGGDSAIVHLALPIGVSFFVFHQISYVVDVYRGVRPAQHRLLPFVTYVSMFPQLIAGPIVRYHELADQLDRPSRSRYDDLVDGFPRFCVGLTKKVVVADSLAPVANNVFASAGSNQSGATVWVGVLAYTLQLYFDFSGYSDMAIGLGRMLGFRLPENFDRPYSSESITEFWQRWHMSLSRWFRDYLYIPLGGNRGTTAQTYRNLWIVFVLVGLWHGANWTFLFWGAYNGALMVYERMRGTAGSAPTPLRRGIRRARTLLLVSTGFVTFRSASLTDAGHLYARMFDVSGWIGTVGLEGLTNRQTVLLALTSLVVLLPRSFVLGRFVEYSRARLADVTRLAFVTVGVSYASLLVMAGSFSPFLYYQF